MSDAQGPNMSREWTRDIGNKLLTLVREERGKTMTVSFVAANEEALAVLDLNGIRHTETPDGIDVMFPGNVQISSDQGESQQPSYYTYQVGAEKFVYPLDTQTLVVE